MTIQEQYAELSKELQTKPGREKNWLIARHYAVKDNEGRTVVQQKLDSDGDPVLDLIQRKNYQEAQAWGWKEYSPGEAPEVAKPKRQR